MDIKNVLHFLWIMVMVIGEVKSRPLTGTRQRFRGARPAEKATKEEDQEEEDTKEEEVEIEHHLLL